jgi:hypothetical protein
MTALGALESDVSFKRNWNDISDFVKLAKQMKLILHQLVFNNVQYSVTCGILVIDKTDL